MRASGADIEIPSVQDARDQFDEWLFSPPLGGEATPEIMMRRALGLKER